MNRYIGFSSYRENPMLTNRARLLLLVLTTAAVAACSTVDATSPSTRVKPSAASRDDIIPGDSTPNGSCRSGYQMANGRCTG
jgi:predicted component of type VI protein secretion system